MQETELQQEPKVDKDKITRRQFLTRGTAAILATALGAGIVKEREELLFALTSFGFYTELLKRGKYRGHLILKYFKGTALLVFLLGQTARKKN